jgi:hypothetical protein
MELKTQTYAGIDNGIVVNFIVGYENCEHPYDEIVCIEDFDNGEYPVMLGSSYVNGKFIPSEENLREIQTQKELYEKFLWENARSERDQKLAQSDILVLKHIEKGEEVPSALQDYRQELRDMPKTITDIENINWPTYQ